MIKLEAPYPAIQTTTVLPNPELGDSEGLTTEVQMKYAMDGTTYSYVKTKGGRRKLIYTIKMDRPKGLELQAFIRAYYESTIKLTDHKNDIWIGKFTSNPFSFETGSSEAQTIQLEFEGIKQ